MLKRLRVRGFRNLGDLDWTPSPGANLVLGRNGAGKTSLLEAVYLAATTRSFRTPRLAEAVRHGGKGFHLSADVGPEGRVTLEMAWVDGERRRAVNERTGTVAEHLAQLPLVLWTAIEKELLTGGPDVGRRVLDRSVVSLRPAALESLGRYRKALRQKRQLLKAGRDPTLLAGFDDVLAEAGSEVVAGRRAYVDRLNTALGELWEESSPDLARPVVRYSSSPRGGEDAVEFRVRLEESSARERAAESPLMGPHRDLLRFYWQDRQIKRVGSAGEIKALGLLIVAAQGRVLTEAGRTPVYLLDDVDTELDRGRLERVWEVFRNAPQLLATSSRPADWRFDSVASIWTMTDGGLAPAPEARIADFPTS